MPKILSCFDWPLRACSLASSCGRKQGEETGRKQPACSTGRLSWCRDSLLLLRLLLQLLHYCVVPFQVVILCISLGRPVLSLYGPGPRKLLLGRFQLCFPFDPE